MAAGDFQCTVVEQRFGHLVVSSLQVQFIPVRPPPAPPDSAPALFCPAPNWMLRQDDNTSECKSATTGKVSKKKTMKSFPSVYFASEAAKSFEKHTKQILWQIFNDKN